MKDSFKIFDNFFPLTEIERARKIAQFGPNLNSKDCISKNDFIFPTGDIGLDIFPFNENLINLIRKEIQGPIVLSYCWGLYRHGGS